MMAHNYSLPFKSNTEIMKNETKSQPNQNLIGCEINTQRVRSVLCCAFFSLYVLFHHFAAVSYNIVWLIVLPLYEISCISL